MAFPDIPISFSGTACADPKLYQTQGKTPVANFTLAVNHRHWDAAAKQWVKGATTFKRCKAFGRLAEGIGSNLRIGMRVVIIGSESCESYCDRNTGEQRSMQVVTVADAGPSLMFAASQDAAGPAMGAGMFDYAPPAGGVDDPYAQFDGVSDRA